MELSQEKFAQYHASVSRLAQYAVQEADAVIADMWMGDGQMRRDVLASIIRGVVPQIADRYGLAAAEVSAALWEEIYETSVGVAAGAIVPDDDYDERFGDAAVTTALGKLGHDERPPEANVDLVRGFVGQMVGKAVRDRAREVQTYNTRRVVERGMRGADGARFARIPTGDTTCAFCLTLASRGFVYYTRETAGEFDKYHDDCDCEVVSSFDGDSASLENYSPSLYYDMYSNAIARPSETAPIDLRATLSNMRSMYGLK